MSFPFDLLSLADIYVSASLPSDHGIGDSPMRSVMRHLVQLVVGQHRYWQSHGRYHVIRWFGRRDPRLERDAALRTAGFISLLHLVLLLVGPDPISPWLLLLALLRRSYACRVDEPFMASVDAGLLLSVQPWRSLDTTRPLPQEPAHPLISCLGACDIDVRLSLRAMAFTVTHVGPCSQPEHYGTEPLSPEDVDAIEQALVSSLVFGGRQVADDPDMHAFTDGVFAAHPQRRALIAVGASLMLLLHSLGSRDI